MLYPTHQLMSAMAAANEACANIQCAPALAGQAALSAMSLTVQHRVNVKRLDGLSGPCSLAFLSEGVSGDRKSTLDSLFTRGIRRFERHQSENNKLALQRHRALMSIWSAKHKSVLRQIREAVKADEPLTDLQRELEEVLSVRPAPPTTPQLIVTDATPEALSARAAIWPSVGWFSDDAGVVLNSRSATNFVLALICKFWDGEVPPVDRVSRASTQTAWVRLTVSFMVQPGILRRFLSGKGASARVSGYLARHLCASPASVQGFRFINDAPRVWTAAQEFENRVFDILQDSTADGGLDEPRVLELSPSAQRQWIDFYNRIEGDLQAGRFLADVKDAASKIAENAARLGGVLHEFAGKLGPIDVETILAAIELCSWYIVEFRRMFSEEAQLPPEFEDAAAVERWLQRLVQSNPGTTTVRESYLQQFITPHHLRRKRRLEPALAMLAQQGKITGTILGRATWILLSPLHFGQCRI